MKNTQFFKTLWPPLSESLTYWIQNPKSKCNKSKNFQVGKKITKVLLNLTMFGLHITKVIQFYEIFLLKSRPVKRSQLLVLPVQARLQLSIYYVVFTILTKVGFCSMEKIFGQFHCPSYVSKSALFNKIFSFLVEKLKIIYTSNILRFLHNKPLRQPKRYIWITSFPRWLILTKLKLKKQVVACLLAKNNWFRLPVH